jgi:hypothetical protein
MVAASGARAQTVTEVKVERVRPQREKHPTFRFLKENRDWLRARLDLLRAKSVERKGGGEEIDPRFLAYQKLLAEARTSLDSVSTAEDLRRRRDLLASINDLGTLESELDMMDRQLAAQRQRLGILQDDFTGRQRTALVVVLSGYPRDIAVSQIAITLDDSSTQTIPITAEQRQALRFGGIVQVFHEFVEPREQIVQVAMIGDVWPSGEKGYVTLEPARDRITFLRLDLSGVRVDRGAAGIQASTWLHDTSLRAGGG